MGRSFIHRALLPLAACWGIAQGVCACSVPVFRYALERWHSDPYTVYLIHDGTTPRQIDEAEKFLLPYARFGALDIIRANLSDARVAEAIRKKGLSPKDPPPRLVVALPGVYSRKPIVVMDAPLAVQSLEELVDSPVRRELARRLISGESAVWLLMESGDRRKDDAAEKLLREELQRMEKQLTLPELDAEDMRRLELAQDDLRIDFSVLRFSRDDPKEAVLADMLMRSSPGRDFSAREPAAFPVFGRGRKLAAFVGSEISAENIRGACTFMTGSCSCEVKEANPGVDLLIPIDWDRYIDNLIGFDASHPPLAGFSRFAPSDGKEEAVAAPTVSNAVPSGAETVRKGSALRRNLLVVGGTLLVLAGLSTAWVLRKGGGK